MPLNSGVARFYDQTTKKLTCTKLTSIKVWAYHWNGETLYYMTSCNILFRIEQIQQMFYLLCNTIWYNAKQSIWRHGLTCSYRSSKLLDHDYVFVANCRVDCALGDASEDIRRVCWGYVRAMFRYGKNEKWHRDDVHAVNMFMGLRGVPLYLIFRCSLASTRATKTTTTTSTTATTTTRAAPLLFRPQQRQYVSKPLQDLRMRA